MGVDVLEGGGEEGECRVQVGGALFLALGMQGDGHMKVQQCSTCESGEENGFERGNEEGGSFYRDCTHLHCQCTQTGPGCLAG